MFNKLRTIIVDDEPMALNGIKNYLSKFDYIELIAMCENAIEAKEILLNQKIDLMFLDINMPRISGIEFLKSLKNKPITIIFSAYPEFALEGYDLNVTDYLVKPILFDRFSIACEKAKDFFELQQKKVNDIDEFFFVKCDKKLEKIFYSDILYVESLRNYIAIFTNSKRYITYLTLKNIEEQLPKNKFIKVQKSFVVSIEKIDRLNTESVFVKNTEIPLSRANKESITKFILNNKYFKR